jgi:hypothetical protein
MIRLMITSALAVLALASCASDEGSADRSRPQDGTKPLSQRLNEGGGYTKDSEGNWVPRQNKRSAYEGKDAGSTLRKTQPRKVFATDAYESKSWWGRKDYQKPSFDGQKDGNRFRKVSRADGLGARESGSAARIPDTYQTGRYATGAATEASKKQMEKPSDAETDERRRVFDSPDVIDWREQRPLTIHETRGILGR